MAAASPPRPGIDAFHRERSRCVDAFAQAERAVNKLLDLTASKRGGEPLKQRMANLRKAKVSPSYSAARKKSVEAALDELEARLPLRADIVHGCLQLAEFENENRACFANARQDSGPGTQMQVFSLADFREVTRLVSKIATELGHKLTQPSPTLQTSPDTAATP